MSVAPPLSTMRGKPPRNLMTPTLHPVDSVTTLLEDVDPIRRSKAHAELGHRAVERDDSDAARVHFSEAVDLDPTDEVSRLILSRLTRARARRGIIQWLFNRG
ncbi:MAG: hypothetical protein HN348_14795 [Proteobacteria bacterium]|nr:hypothetical protein [Pseudomonadota bacterium]